MDEDPEASRENTMHRSNKSPTLEELGLSHSALAYNKNFICSLPCVLMFGETICGLLVWTLLGGTEYLRVPGLGWVMFVSVSCWVMTVCLLLVYLTTAHIKLPHVPWAALVLFFNSSAAVLYITATAINAAALPQAIRGRYYYSSWIASTVFAFLLVLFYTTNAYLSYKSWRSKSDA